MLLCISSHKLWLKERLPTKGAGLFCKPMYAGAHMASKQTSVHMNPLQLCPNSNVDGVPWHFCRTLRPLQNALAVAHRALPYEWWCFLFHAAEKPAAVLCQRPPDTNCAAQQGPKSAMVSQEMQACRQRQNHSFPNPQLFSDSKQAMLSSSGDASCTSSWSQSRAAAQVVFTSCLKSV